MALRLSTSGPDLDDPDRHKAELTEHLAELRTRIIRSCLYCGIGMILVYAFFRPLYMFLSAPLTDVLRSNANVQMPGQSGGFLFTSFLEPFLLKVQISVIGGLIVAIPFVGMELWGFISPGLTRNERRAVRLVAPFSILLFALGVGIAIAIMPMAMRWFLSFITQVPGAVLFQNPLKYMEFFVKTMLVFGIVFQLPVVLTFLGKVGILTSAMMIRYWRQITVGLFTAAMVVAPSNDPGTMLALAIPMTLLFLISIWLVRLVEPKQSSENR